MPNLECIRVLSQSLVCPRPLGARRIPRDGAAPRRCRGRSPRWLVIISLSLLAANVDCDAGTAEQPPSAGAVFVIHAGHLLAVGGRPVLDTQTIVVQDGRITHVEPGFLPADRYGAGSKLIDLSGQFVMAGLSDVHYHFVSSDDESRHAWTHAQRIARATLLAQKQATELLDAGVTTIRDVGDSTNAITLQLRDAINANLIAGPRIFAAGRIVSRTDGHGTEERTRLAFLSPDEPAGCDGIESCRRVVRENIGDGRGSDLIKFTGSGSASEPWGERDAPPTSFDDEVEAIVATARVLGRKVAVHAHSAASINQALRAGAWTIEHGTYFDNESVRLFRERKAYLVPTSFVGELMLEDPRIKARNTPEDWQRIKVVAQHQLENAGRGYRAGVALGVGTDSSSGLDPRNTMREIEIFVRDGIPVEDALKAATLNNAAIVGHSGDLGEVRSGYIADVVAMPASPLKDVRALRDIDFVMKDGKIVRNDVGR